MDILSTEQAQKIADLYREGIKTFPITEGYSANTKRGTRVYFVGEPGGGPTTVFVMVDEQVTTLYMFGTVYEIKHNDFDDGGYKLMLELAAETRDAGREYDWSVQKRLHAEATVENYQKLMDAMTGLYAPKPPAAKKWWEPWVTAAMIVGAMVFGVYMFTQIFHHGG